MRNESIALSEAHEVIRKVQDADRIVWFDGQEYLNLDDVAHLLAGYMTGQP